MSPVGDLAKADALLDLNRPAEAIVLISTALATEPSSAPLLCRLARAHLDSKQPELAVAAARQAIASAPDDEWGYRLLSMGYGELGDYRNSVNAAYEAVRLGPQRWRTHTRCAIACALAGHYPQAWQAAHAAVSLAPDIPDTHFAMGFVAARAGNLALAEQAYQKTLELKPDHATAMNNLALIQMRHIGGLRKAVHGLGAALAIDAQLDVARRNLDVAARRFMRIFHYIVLIAFFILSATFGSAPSQTAFDAANNVPAASRLHAAIVGGAALLILIMSVVTLDRRLPANLRPYYRRLPRADKLLGAWILVDLLAVLAICALAVPTTYSGRSGLLGVAWALLIVGVVLSWMPSARARLRRS